MPQSSPSIVKCYSEQQGSCGYCSSPDGFHSYGLHAHTLKVKDYQDMIDRGWRRCGRYCYKPILEKSCCPLYTIRCAATNFKLSKTQKKILKRFNNFLVNGAITKDKIYKTTDIREPMDMHCLSEGKKIEQNSDLVSVKVDLPIEIQGDSLQSNFESTKRELSKPIEKEPVSFGIKEQANKNKCMKAKNIRIERKRQKLQKQGFSEEEINKKMVEKKKYPVVKTIEDYLKETVSKTKVHNLEIKIVSIESPDFKKSFNDSALLFAKYQKIIHQQSEEECGVDTFHRIFVNSPLETVDDYGSYHAQYWLDDKLIAVGVIDILPRCVSSVYFFYDPDYAHLSLGTYGALREIELARQLSVRYPNLVYYYMGFYIHSCVRMKYKGAFKPSYLLCPEAFTWHLIEECLPKIEASKYSRFNEDPNARDTEADVSTSEVLILYNRKVMLLDHYLKKYKFRSEELKEIMEYAKLMGKTCAKNILFFQM